MERIGCDESLRVALATAKPCGGGSGGGAAMTRAGAENPLAGYCPRRRVSRAHKPPPRPVLRKEVLL